MNYLLALDQGTTSSRALIFDSKGEIAGFAQKEFEQHYPQPGWVEHDAGQIWESQFETAQAAIRDAAITSNEIAAIGITNQRETCLLWDRETGVPCGPAIVWQDRRTAASCERLKSDGYEPLVQQRTGLLLDPYFSGSKLHWMLDQDAGLRRRAEAGELAFGTVDSWLLWNLTDGECHATDATNASRTALCNIHTQQWDEDLLKVWDVPAAVLPDIIDSSGIAATTSAFGGDIPIAGIAGDQQAALFGQACFEPGMAKCTYGTGCFMLMNTGSNAVVSNNRLLTTVASRIDNVTEFALEGSVFMGGATVQWLRDGLGIIERAADVEGLAESVEDSGGIILVPAFTGLGAPHWDARAGALMIGMTRGTTSAHIARAALEAIAWQVADVARAMENDADIHTAELRVDGGASNNALLMQIQSDVLGTRLVQPRVEESTAYGAALLAGLGVGMFADRKEISEQWQQNRQFTPQGASAAILAAGKRWRAAIDRSRQWHEIN